MVCTFLKVPSLNLAGLPEPAGAFAFFYALSSGMVFLLAFLIIFTRVLHRLLHHIHLEAEKDDSQSSSGSS